MIRSIRNTIQEKFLFLFVLIVKITKNRLSEIIQYFIYRKVNKSNAISNEERNIEIVSNVPEKINSKSCATEYVHNENCQ